MNKKLFITTISIAVFVFAGGLLYVAFSPIGPGGMPRSVGGGEK